MALQDHEDRVAIMVATGHLVHPEHPEHRENRDLWDPRASMAPEVQKVQQDPKAHPVREGLETIVLAFMERLKRMRTKERLMTRPSRMWW